MKGKKGNHLPPETERRKKSKSNQQAPALDAVKDFEMPTKKEPQQGSLIDAKAPAEPVVQDRFMDANFLKTHFARDKNDKAHVSLEFSIELTAEHRVENVLPKRVIEVWDGLVSLGVDGISVDGVPAQDVDLALAPRAMEKSSGLAIKFGEITNAEISVLQAKGTGTAKDVTLLKFRVKVEWDTHVWRFSGVHCAHQLWLRMAQSQGSLLENESEAA